MRHVINPWTCSTVAASLVAASLTTQASAQSPDWPTTVAVALAAYEASKDECFYEEIVGKALYKMDEVYSSQNPVGWEILKKRVMSSPDRLKNLGKMMGSDSDCKSIGTGVFGGLAPALLTLGPDPMLVKEIERLEGGGGRVHSADAGESTPQTDTPSGSTRIVPGEWRFSLGQEDWGATCFAEMGDDTLSIGFFDTPDLEIVAFVRGVYEGEVRATWQVDTAGGHELDGSPDDYFGWHSFSGVRPSLFAEIAWGEQLTVTAASGKVSASLKGAGDSLTSFNACHQARLALAEKSSP